MTDLTIISPADTFRAKAADCFKASADMSLHNLVDEFARLTAEIEAGKTAASDEDFGEPTYSAEAKVALRERNIINGAARARFGIGFDTYDYSF